MPHLAAALLLLVQAASSCAQGTVQVHHVDVGQGHATLIEGPTGRTCLVDAGDFGMGTGAVVPLLFARGITVLDHVVLTHYHADHWGGIPEVVAAGITIGTAWDRGTQAVFSNISSYVGAVAGVRTTIAPGVTIDLGGGATLTCICVNGQVSGGASVPPSSGSQEENARSVGLRLEFGNYDQAICGDLTGGGLGTADVESAAGSVLGDVDVMLVNHHGSRTSTNATWLQALSPEVSVISVGDGNPFGHPHTETLNAILAAPPTAALYRLRMGAPNPGGTLVGGTLLVETDGANYTVSGGAVPPTLFMVDEGGAPPAGAPLLPGDVVVSEYMSNPRIVADSVGEWIELTNTTSGPLDLAGFTVKDQGTDMFMLPPLVVSSRRSVVLARHGDPTVNGGVTADFVWPQGSFALSNATDEIELLDAGGRVLDAVAYDDGASFPDPDGASVERRDLQALALASNVGESTTPFGLGDLGTPGAANSLDVTGPWVTLSVAGPLTPGSAATFTIDGGPAVGGHPFLMGVSECAVPGIMLPSGRVVDLCATPLLFASTTFVPGFTGTLSLFGVAATGLTIPPYPGLSGQTLHVSGVVLDPAAPDGVATVMDNLQFPIN